MPGLFGKAAATLTEASNHYIDWGRVGERVATARGYFPHYSTQELLDRGFILLSTAIGGYLGSLHEDESPGYYSVAGSTVGFVVSHTLVIIPLIMKRRRNEIACNQYQELIWEKLTESVNPPLKEAVTSCINSIMQHSLSQQEKGNASRTWGQRERLMACLYEKIQLTDLNNSTATNSLITYCNNSLQEETLSLSPKN